MTLEERLAELERRQNLLHDTIKQLLANGFNDDDFSDDQGHAYGLILRDVAASLESGWEKKP